MTDTRTYPDKHFAVVFVPDGGIANEKAPTAAELNAGVQLSPSVAWDGTEINPSASSDIDDAAITDSATAVEPGFDQYTVTTAHFYPKDLSLVSHPFVIAYGTVTEDRVKGYIVRRYKPGDAKSTTWDDSFVGGDWVEVFRVEADSVAQDTAGEDSTKYTVTWPPQGFMSGQVMVKTASAPVVPTTAAVDAGDAIKISAALGGYDITADATWTSSDDAVATVSNGVVVGVSAGTATITAAYASATGTDTCTVTVS